MDGCDTVKSQCYADRPARSRAAVRRPCRAAPRKGWLTGQPFALTRCGMRAWERPGVRMRTPEGDPVIEKKAARMKAAL